MSAFSGERNINFGDIERIRVKGRKTVLSVSESLMLERRGSNNLLNIGYSICYLKQYCLSLTVSLDEQHHLELNQPILVNGKSTASL